FINSARIAVVAIDCFVFTARNLASINGARISIIADPDRSRDTLSINAFIFGARIIIVAEEFLVNASLSFHAIILCTRIVVIAVLGSEDTSFVLLTGIISAHQVITANSGIKH